MPFTSQYSGLPLAAGTTVADAIAVGYRGSPASPGHEATDGHDCLAGIVGLVGASLADAAIFRLPTERIRQGYYSDAYFVYTKETLEAEGRRPQVTMQVFQKKESVLGGIDEAIAILKLCSGREENGTWIPGWNELEVHA